MPLIKVLHASQDHAERIADAGTAIVISEIEGTRIGPTTAIASTFEERVACEQEVRAVAEPARSSATAS